MSKENKYNFWFNTFGKGYGVDPDLLKAQVKAESNFDHKAVSPAGAKGLSQFMDKTWLEWEDETPGIQDEFVNFDPFNPEDSIRVQAAYMAWLLKQFDNNTDKALAAYNWGIGNVKKLLKEMSFEEAINKMPLETQDYIKRINKFYKKYQEEKMADEKVKTLSEIKIIARPNGPNSLPQKTILSVANIKPLVVPKEAGVDIGTEQLHEVVVAGVALTNALIINFDKGLVPAVPSYISAATKIPVAIEGIEKVPEEAEDLDEKELKAEIDYIKKELNVTDEKAMLIVQASINAVYANYQLIKIIKS